MTGYRFNIWCKMYLSACLKKNSNWLTKVTWLCDEEETFEIFLHIHLTCTHKYHEINDWYNSMNRLIIRSSSHFFLGRVSAFLLKSVCTSFVLFSSCRSVTWHGADIQETRLSLLFYSSYTVWNLLQTQIATRTRLGSVCCFKVRTGPRA